MAICWVSWRAADAPEGAEMGGIESGVTKADSSEEVKSFAADSPPESPFDQKGILILVFDERIH